MDMTTRFAALKRRAADRVLAEVGRRGYRLTRPRFHEENAIDLRALLAAPIEARRGRFVVLQIGANDGVVNDPIHDAVVRRGWELYAVEPVPATFAKLQETYAGNPKVRYVPCAVGPADGETTIYTLRQDESAGGLPYDQFASLSRATVEQHWRAIPDVRGHVEEVSVPMLTLTSLIRAYDVPDVDMVQIDTEGFDYEIIKMAFASGLTPSILAFEWVNLSEADMWQCRCDLIEHGYHWLIDKGDVIAFRGTVADPPVVMA